MSQSYRYDAFISYRHVEPDRKWAKWLHRTLEGFRTPRPLVQKGFPQKMSRVFRDEEELAATADLSKEINRALQESKFLIVVCSPSAPESKWINEEIRRFGGMGREDRILALLVDGEPDAAFPPALRNIQSGMHAAVADPLAADVRPTTGDSRHFRKRMGFLRLAATVLGCRFDDLRQRAQERRNRRILGVVAVAALLVAGFFPIRNHFAEKAALEEASEARGEAGRMIQRADIVRAEAESLRTKVVERRVEVVDNYATTEERADFARTEQALLRKTTEAAHLLEGARRSLERAARYEAPWGGTSAKTHGALADFFFARWEEAQARGDDLQAGLYSALVLEHAPAREAELLGRGTLTITVGPESASEAEAFLFRYASYETVRTDPPVVPRLVPVPTTGIGLLREGAWVGLEGEDAFFPGDLCQEVTAVEPGSPAAEAGLVAGDLVVRLDGQPCGDGLFVAWVMPGGEGDKAGIRPGQRFETINDMRVEGLYEPWAVATDKNPTQPIRVGFADGIIEVPPGEDFYLEVGLLPAHPAEFVGSELAPAPMRLSCLGQGVPVDLLVAEGASSGLRVEPTAYPLILAEDNRVPLGVEIEADPGSYLLYVRVPGFEAQRYPLVVPRDGHARADLGLLPAGSTPEGFVYVPPGPFVVGGDPYALKAGPREDRVGEGFFIGRYEVTYGEWSAFLKDPRTQREIRASQDAGMTIYLPRSVTAPSGYVNYKADDSVPIMGISRIDIDGFLAWRNRKAEKAGEPWIYDLPTEWQWEQAARGADARFCPWGNRFDPSLCVGYYRKAKRLRSFSGGFEPRDASVYGVRDLGGSRYEWTRDEYAPGAGMYPVRGGAWGQLEPGPFHSASRFSSEPHSVDMGSGFRLLVRRRPR